MIVIISSCGFKKKSAKIGYAWIQLHLWSSQLSLIKFKLSALLSGSSVSNLILRNSPMYLRTHNFHCSLWWNFSWPVKIHIARNVLCNLTELVAVFVARNEHITFLEFVTTSCEVLCNEVFIFKEKIRKTDVVSQFSCLEVCSKAYSVEGEEMWSQKWRRRGKGRKI